MGQGPCWPVGRWARSHHGRLQGCAGPETGVHPLVLLPWVLEHEILCAPCKSGVSLSHSPLELESQN